GVPVQGFFPLGFFLWDSFRRALTVVAYYCQQHRGYRKGSPLPRSEQDLQELRPHIIPLRYQR
ncbi:hypothetical protein NDU88_003730, partial [Pleurodeles waltl]